MTTGAAADDGTSQAARAENIADGGVDVAKGQWRNGEWQAVSTFDKARSADGDGVAALS